MQNILKSLTGKYSNNCLLNLSVSGWNFLFYAQNQAKVFFLVPHLLASQTNCRQKTFTANRWELDQVHWLRSPNLIKSLFQHKCHFGLITLLPKVTFILTPPTLSDSALPVGILEGSKFAVPIYATFLTYPFKENFSH